MRKKEILAELKTLNLPSDAYVVFGSAPLAIAGFREAQDIDLYVSKALYAELRKRGWRNIEKGPGDTPLVHGVFEAHDHWGFSAYHPTLEELQSTATVIEGIPFAALEEVRKWKKASGRPKDLADIALMDGARV